ncbi:MAG: hypothetical protein Q7S46_12705 [Gallionella sp.]|nr:hypothetical protein [Gallionella sp.]
MTCKLYQSIDVLIKENAELTLKLQLFEAEIGNLKLAVERLEDAQRGLTVKLEEANNEVSRAYMVLKHQGGNLKSIRQHGKQH